MSQAAAIDQFLKNRKSPMAGYGKVFVAAGKKYGVDPRLVVAISGIESSFGKHTLGAHNAWGWGPGKKFGSWEDGISSVTKGLRTGYLDRGLRTPEKIVHRYAPGSDGNDTGNWVRVVNQFLGEMGGKVKPVKASAGVSVPGAPPRSTPAAAIELPEFDPSPYLRQTAMGNLAEISLTGKTDPMAMLQRTSQGLNDLATARLQYEDIVKSMRVTDPNVYPAPTEPTDAGAAEIDEVMRSDSVGARAVKMAATQLGDPYVFGASSAGKNPGSFDCSSLVQWSYRQLGIDIPRDTYGQQKVLKPKSWKNLQIGDPIYRRSGGHVVIYAGGNRVIAAPHSGTVVKYQPLSQFSQDDYVPYTIPH